MEAAFFDLDKTIIAKSSVLAFGKPFYREGLLSRRSIVKSIYAQVVFMLVGADEEKMEKLRAAMAAMTRGWNRDHVASIVRETLNDVIEPIIFAEALELFDEHHAAGREVVIVSSSPTEVVEPLAEFLGADELHRHPRRGRRRRQLHRRARVLRLRRRQGGGDPRARRPGGHRSRRVLRLQRLDHRPPDARDRRPSRRREPRQASSPGSHGNGAGRSASSPDRSGCATGCRCRRRARRSRSAVCSPPPAPAWRCGGGSAAASTPRDRADDVP